MLYFLKFHVLYETVNGKGKVYLKCGETTRRVGKKLDMLILKSTSGGFFDISNKISP